jgi:hypothetical protein
MHTTQIYMASAVLGGILAAVGLGVFLRRHFTPSQTGGGGIPGKTPPAPLEKRAWWGLGITIATILAVVAVFLVRDASLYHEDRPTRLIVLAIVIVGALAYAVLAHRTRLARGAGEVMIDERDRMIIERAPAVQLYAVFIALAVWCIALTEVYWERGAIPVFYPYVMFWTTYAVGIIAWSVAVLVGYRRL